MTLISVKKRERAVSLTEQFLHIVSHSGKANKRNAANVNVLIYLPSVFRAGNAQINTGNGNTHRARCKICQSQQNRDSYLLTSTLVFWCPMFLKLYCSMRTRTYNLSPNVVHIFKSCYIYTHVSIVSLCSYEIFSYVFKKSLVISKL